MSEVVLLAGGGTGGHVFPLVAIAHALRELRPSIRPIFIGTERGMETRFVPEQGFELELLPVLPLRGGGVTGALRGAFRAASLLPTSRALLRRLQPRGVFSVGGYAAGPISLAAHFSGLPLALLEPNSVIGLANALLAPFVDRAYTAFEKTDTNFKPDAVRRYGVPLRAGFRSVPYRSAFHPPFKILILGGSLGASKLNEVVPGALARLGVPCEITHQCGSKDQQEVERRYAGWAEGRAVVTPFIQDMQGALSQADLVIGRAGASAVSEIAAVGRPSLLIPYPYASGDHQRVNAEALSKSGAAVCVLNAEADEERLVQELQELFSDLSRLPAMARAAATWGKADAAQKIALDFLELIGLKEKGDR